MKVQIFILCFLNALACFAQIQFQQFNPVPYEPQTADMSILQRSLELNEQRATEAQNVFTELVNFCSETAKEMPPSEMEWFKGYCDSICKEVQDQISLGNTQSAILLAYDLKSNMRADKRVQYRIDSYRIYCAEIENHGLYNYRNRRCNQTAYEWYLWKNPYKFQPVYDSDGQLTSYNKCFVGYLYPSLNWNELVQYVTSRGNTKEAVEGMWKFYFMYSDKHYSLYQEFYIACDVLNNYLAAINRSDLSEPDKDALQKEIHNLKTMLYDDENKESFDVFVDNLRKQLIVEPVPKAKHTSKKRAASRKTSRKRVARK